jgi:Tfp pilus assembly protein PilF
MGIRMNSLDNFQLASECFIAVLSMQPNFGKAQIGLGYAYTKLGEVEESKHSFIKAKKLHELAIDQYQNALKQAPFDLNQYNLAFTLVRFGETLQNIENNADYSGIIEHSFEIAESLLIKVLENNPANISALQSLAYIYSKTGRSELVEAKLQTAIDLCKNNPNPFVYHKMAMFYVRTKNKIKAEEFFRKTLELKPDFPSALTNYGHFLKEQKRTQEAIDILEMAIRCGSQRPVTYSILARIYNEKNNLKRAIELLLTALSINPGYLEARASLAYAYTKLKDFEAAGKEYALLLPYADDDPKIYSLYAFFLSSKSDQENISAAETLKLRVDSEKYFLLALKNFPDEEDTMHTLAILYERLGRLDEATTLFEKMTTAESPNPRVMMSYIYLLDHAKEYHKLIEMGEKLLHIDPTNCNALTRIIGAIDKLVIDPERFERIGTQQNLPWIMEKLNDYLNLTTHFIALYPKNIFLPLDLAMIYSLFSVLSEDSSDNAQYFNRADSQFQRVSLNLVPFAYIQFAMLHYMQGNINSADKILDECITNHPDYIPGYLNYAKFLKITGRTSEAMNLLLNERTRLESKNMQKSLLLLNMGIESRNILHEA